MTKNPVNDHALDLIWRDARSYNGWTDKGVPETLIRATYDLTNLATLKDWPVKIVVVDILWGMVLCGLVSAGGFLVATLFL
mgnify:CR=1 FL=1